MVLKSVCWMAVCPVAPLLVSMEKTEAVTQQQGRLVQVHVARRKLCEAQGCSTQS